MKTTAIPTWYLRLTRTLHLDLVYPAVMVIGSTALVITYIDAVSGFFSGIVAITFFALAYLLNSGYGRGNLATRALFTLCVFLETPNQYDPNAGLAYFFLFIITGIVCTLVQAAYLFSLVF